MQQRGGSELVRSRGVAVISRGSGNGCLCSQWGMNIAAYLLINLQQHVNKQVTEGMGGSEIKRGGNG